MTWFQQQRKSTKQERSKRHRAQLCPCVCKHHKLLNVLLNTQLHTICRNSHWEPWANVKDPWELWAGLGGCLDLTLTFPHSITVPSSLLPSYTDLQKVEGQWEEPLRAELAVELSLKTSKQLIQKISFCSLFEQRTRYKWHSLKTFAKSKKKKEKEKKSHHSSVNKKTVAPAVALGDFECLVFHLIKQEVRIKFELKVCILCFQGLVKTTVQTAFSTDHWGWTVCPYKKYFTSACL